MKNGCLVDAVAVPFSTTGSDRQKRPFPGMFCRFCIFVLIEGKPATILSYIYIYIRTCNIPYG